MAESIYRRTSRMTSPLRLPFFGNIDLTYRCNNNCLHCWLRIPADDPETGKRELTSDEILDIVAQARSMGTQKWAISGGEPMLRSDFAEIFDFITRKAAYYSLNTNATLITPKTAKLLKRKGAKMIALYGATADTYDRVTRHPGGFDLVLRGIRYLKEAGAGFMIQAVPMRENRHEWERMIEFAESLGVPWRNGAPWLCLSASRDPRKNGEIISQRLDPADAIILNQAEGLEDLTDPGHEIHSCGPRPGEDRLFAACVPGRGTFHIDPEGGMTFCSYVKAPGFRFDLRGGTFREAWDVFIPSLVEKALGGREYAEHCGRCDLRAACLWCPAHAYQEHGRFTAQIEYFCDTARATRAFAEQWEKEHRRYYRIAEITIRVESDLPIAEATFGKKFKAFEVNGPGADNIQIRHHFSIPDLEGRSLGRLIYRKAPWAIYQKNDRWVYVGMTPDHGPPERVAVFNGDHSRGQIYNLDDRAYREGDLHALTMLATDQILIGRLLAERRGFYLHSAAAILDGQGFLFVGRSDAGKTTITSMLLSFASAEQPPFRSFEILCDDRNIVRKMNEEWRVYGSWSHGDISLVSGSSAPLKAVFFLEKATENRLIPLIERGKIAPRLLSCLIKPLATEDWWEKTLNQVERMIQEIPFYVMRFDKTGAILTILAGHENSLKY